MGSPTWAVTVTEDRPGSNVEDEEGAHWFYSAPYAGVRYYYFKKLSNQPGRIESKASDVTKPGVPLVFNQTNSSRRL